MQQARGNWAAGPLNLEFDDMLAGVVDEGEVDEKIGPTAGGRCREAAFCPDEADAKLGIDAVRVCLVAKLLIEPLEQLDDAVHDGKVFADERAP